MSIRYRIPDGLPAARSGARWFVPTPQGGRVAVDERIVALREIADGRELLELLEDPSLAEIDRPVLLAGLACLVEAGLLLREGVDQPARLPQPQRGKLVSAVIVAYNGREWLADLLPSLLNQNYAPLEIIVVDNGSKAPVGEWLAQAYPQVKVHSLSQPASLAAAINLGVELAAGDYYLVLNQDLVLDPQAVAEMVAAAEGDPGCGAVACKLYFLWAPRFLNGVGNRVESYSWGTDNAIGWLDLGQFDHWEEVPSTCYAATLIPKPAWQAIGPVDEGFPLYYEDTEWSYRARLLGWRIRLAPQAAVYHAFGGKVPTGEDGGLTPGKLANVAYGRLRFAKKVVVDELYDQYALNYSREDGNNLLRSLAMLDFKSAGAYLRAWRKFHRDSKELDAARDAIMQRKIGKAEDVFHIGRSFPRAMIWNGLPELTWEAIQKDYLPIIRAGKTKPMPEFNETNLQRKVLVVSHDVVSTSLAGTGMRYLEMARALCADFDVTLAVPQETDLTVPGIRIVRYWEDRPASLQVLVENNDVALVSGYMIEKFPFLATTETSLVVDLYDPLVLENVHYYLDRTTYEQDVLNQAAVSVTNRLVQCGDFFICGNERQRDFWMGVLAANGRVNPHTIKEDPGLNRLLDIVGIGFPSREPNRQPYLKGSDPLFPDGCRIVLWGGGIWNWLDPLTLIKAWPAVVARHSDARLVFLGTRHPNPQVPHHAMVDKALRLAEETGELDHTIRFLEWISYSDREALLSEADVGVTLHPVTIETRYSLRTRVLDYIWARLPILITQGDVTSEWVQENRLGCVVPEGDEVAVAAALNELLDRPKAEWAPAFDRMHDLYRWERVVEPLRRYCQNPRHAPDRIDRVSRAVIVAAPQSKLHKARAILKEQGLGALAWRALYHAYWLLTRRARRTES